VTGPDEGGFIDVSSVRGPREKNLHAVFPGLLTGNLTWISDVMSRRATVYLLTLAATLLSAAALGQERSRPQLTGSPAEPADSLLVHKYMPDSLFFEADSVSSGSLVTLVVLGSSPLGERYEVSVTFDGQRADIVDVVGRVIRLVVPDGLRLFERPFVVVTSPDGEVGLNGPVIVPFVIESVAPAPATQGQPLEIRLGRELLAVFQRESEQVDHTVDPSILRVSVSGVDRALLVQSASVRMRTFDVFLDDVEPTLFEQLRGYAKRDLTVLVWDQPSVPMVGLRIEVPVAWWWYATAAVLGFPALYYLYRRVIWQYLFLRRRIKSRNARLRADTIERPRSTPPTETPPPPPVILRPSPPGSPPKGLIEVIASGDCVLFAGSGLSAQAGLPAWRDFLRGLVEYTEDYFSATDEVISGEAAGLLRSLAKGQYEAVADELTSRLPPATLQ
jgi:hypothetical protein